jgi:hypothetical protein
VLCCGLKIVVSETFEGVLFFETLLVSKTTNGEFWIQLIMITCFVNFTMCNVASKGVDLCL